MSPGVTPADIQRLERRLAETPDSLVFARLADAYRKAVLLDRGLEVVEQGLRHHPEYVSGHLVRARILRQLQRHEEARRAFVRVLELDPHNLVALRASADLAREAGDVEEARRAYERFLEVEPFDEQVRRALTALPRAEEVARAGPAATEPDPWLESLGRQVTDLERPETAEQVTAPAPETVEEPGEAEPREDVTESVGEEGEAIAEETAIDREDTVVAEEEAELETGAEEEEQATGAAEAATEAPEPEAEEPVEEELEPIAETAEPAAEIAESAEGAAEIAESAEGAAEIAEAPQVGEEVEQEEPDEREEGSDAPMTATMAELYLKQGLYAEAIRIYERLLEVRPNDFRLQEKLKAAHLLSERGPAARRRVRRPEAPEPDEEPSASTGEAAAATEPEAGSDRVAPEGPVIRDYLRALVEGRATREPTPGERQPSRFREWLEGGDRR